MPNGETAEGIFGERVGPTDPAREAMARRLLELRELQQRGDPAFQAGSAFLTRGRTGQWVGRALRALEAAEEPDWLDPTGVGGYTLTFAQTEAGQRLAAALALETERVSGRERLKLEETIHALAMELLPPGDVETAMRQVRRGELVKSKLAFQAVLQNLADEAEHADRRADLDLAEENERRTLREARARITIDLMGRDLGRAILFALGAGE